MKKSRYSEEQIIGILKQSEAGPRNGRSAWFTSSRAGQAIAKQEDLNREAMTLKHESS